MYKKKLARHCVSAVLVMSLTACSNDNGAEGTAGVQTGTLSLDNALNIAGQFCKRRVQAQDFILAVENVLFEMETQCTVQTGEVHFSSMLDSPASKEGTMNFSAYCMTVENADYQFFGKVASKFPDIVTEVTNLNIKGAAVDIVLDGVFTSMDNGYTLSVSITDNISEETVSLLNYKSRFGADASKSGRVSIMGEQFSIGGDSSVHILSQGDARIEIRKSGISFFSAGSEQGRDLGVLEACQ